MINAAVLLVALPIAANAASPAPAFEQSLNEGRALMLEKSQTQLQARPRQDIAEAAFEARAIALNEDRLRADTSAFAQRARAHRRRPDLMLPNDLRRAIFELQNLQRRLSSLAKRAKELADSARPDSDAVPAAQDFQDSAWDMRYEALLIQVDCSRAAPELRASSFAIEAFRLERGTEENEQLAGDVYIKAREIRNKTAAANIRAENDWSPFTK